MCRIGYHYCCECGEEYRCEQSDTNCEALDHYDVPCAKCERWSTQLLREDAYATERRRQWIQEHTFTDED
jgi:hypothetical protein